MGRILYPEMEIDRDERVELIRAGRSRAAGGPRDASIVLTGEGLVPEMTFRCSLKRLNCRRK
jgi:hypothetical protein